MAVESHCGARRRTAKPARIRPRRQSRRSSVESDSSAIVGATFVAESGRILRGRILVRWWAAALVASASSWYAEDVVNISMHLENEGLTVNHGIPFGFFFVWSAGDAHPYAGRIGMIASKDIEKLRDGLDVMRARGVKVCGFGERGREEVRHFGF